MATKREAAVDGLSHLVNAIVEAVYRNHGLSTEHDAATIRSIAATIESAVAKARHRAEQARDAKATRLAKKVDIDRRKAEKAAKRAQEREAAALARAEAKRKAQNESAIKKLEKLNELRNKRLAAINEKLTGARMAARNARLRDKRAARRSEG